MVSVGSDPRLEGVGLGFGSSLPVLPGARAMLRQMPACAPAPSSSPAPPSAELSPPVRHLYLLGALAPVQGGPGGLQRQEGQGLRCGSPPPLLPSLLPHPVPTGPASCPQGAVPREPGLTAPAPPPTLLLFLASQSSLAPASSLPLSSENRAQLFLAVKRPLDRNPPSFYPFPGPLHFCLSPGNLPSALYASASPSVTWDCVRLTQSLGWAPSEGFGES